MRPEGKRGRMERNLQTGSQVVDTSCHERYQCFLPEPIFRPGSTESHLEHCGFSLGRRSLVHHE